MSRFKSKTPISPVTTTKGGLRNKKARIRQLLKDRRGNELLKPFEKGQKPRTYKPPINPAVIDSLDGGSPNQKFKDEKENNSGIDPNMLLG